MSSSEALWAQLRLQGGGSAEQREYVEEEVVEFKGTKRRQTEFKLIEDNGSLARQTPFWICSECGNMLYPKEDRASRTLKRVCRNCSREDNADNNLVYVNDLRPAHRQQSIAGVDQVKDPTLPRATGVECSNCGHDEAVFFQAPMKGDEAMKLIFMCMNCAHRWLQ
jgi:DNA-directed RNA polymerase II subunit RPB9